MKFKKLLSTVAIAGLLASVTAYAAIPLGGSIFPLTYISQSPTNLTDLFNEMEALISQQVDSQTSLASSTVPGGRLTLSSTLPVATADVTAATSIYYLPYTNEFLPIYNGTSWVQYDMSSTGFNQGLATADQPASEMFDVYAVNVNGTPTMCSLYWGGNTSRSATVGGAGAADARIVQLNGLWVNKTAIATGNCFGGTGGITAVVIPANQGTLLGSYYTSANGQTQTVCNPTPASGGAAIGMFVSNAYNRVNADCSSSDTATAQTSVSASWAKLGANDTAQFVDSLQQVAYNVDAHVVAGGSAAGVDAQFGVACAGTGTTAPTVLGGAYGATATLADNYNTIAVHQGFYPILGLSPTCFAEKQSPSTTSVTYMPVSTDENMTLSIQY